MSAERDEVVLSVLSALLDLFFLFSFFLSPFSFSFSSPSILSSSSFLFLSSGGLFLAQGAAVWPKTGVVMRAETFGGSGFL